MSERLIMNAFKALLPTALAYMALRNPMPPNIFNVGAAFFLSFFVLEVSGQSGTVEALRKENAALKRKLLGVKEEVEEEVKEQLENDSEDECEDELNEEEDELEEQLEDDYEDEWEDELDEDEDEDDYEDEDED